MRGEGVREDEAPAKECTKEARVESSTTSSPQKTCAGEHTSVEMMRMTWTRPRMRHDVRGWGNGGR